MYNTLENTLALSHTTSSHCNSRISNMLRRCRNKRNNTSWHLVSSAYNMCSSPLCSTCRCECMYACVCACVSNKYSMCRCLLCSMCRYVCVFVCVYPESIICAAVHVCARVCVRVYVSVSVSASASASVSVFVSVCARACECVRPTSTAPAAVVCVRSCVCM